MRRVFGFVALIIGLPLLVIAYVGVTGNAMKSMPSSASQEPVPTSCAASDFTLSKLKASTEYEIAKLTGIVRNNCNDAVGVQLKWTAFNSDGTVAFSNDFWPASTTNIPPKTDYAFEMMETAPRGKWTYTVQPISLTQW